MSGEDAVGCMVSFVMYFCLYGTIFPFLYLLFFHLFCVCLIPAQSNVAL